MDGLRPGAVEVSDGGAGFRDVFVMGNLNGISMGFYGISMEI